MTNVLMTNVLRKILVYMPVSLGTAALLTPLTAYGLEANGLGDRSSASLLGGQVRVADPWADGSEPMAQVTSVSQLSDVQPTDWAFQALQSLVERYGCIAGYPDGTFRGNRALSRYEFAAGLNACLDRVNELLAAGLTDKVSYEDLAVLERLQEQFAAELATLRGRVDALEARTAELEANQFSTTTKLHGEVIFDISDSFEDLDDTAGCGCVPAASDNQTVFRYRVRLDLVTSFTGEDALHTRLAVGEVESFFGPGVYSVADDLGLDDELASAEGSVAQSVGGSTGGDIVLDWLGYYFPIGDRIDAYVVATGGRHHQYVPSTVNPYFSDFDGGQGGISTFSQESPIYRIGGGAGGSLSFAFDDEETFVLTAGYLADDPASPAEGDGIFNGDYAALGQLTISPGDKLQVGLTYVHGFHTDDNLIFDSGFGNEFFVGTVPASATHVELDTAAVTNSYGVQLSYEFSPHFAINAFGGYSDVIFVEEDDSEIWYYGLGLAFPDLFKMGNLGGIMVGVEPYLGDTEVSDIRIFNDTSVHVEAFYRYQVTDNISLTPGVIWITAPNQNENNDDSVIVTLRSTFRF
ncbi:MAG: iron uptake porin [Leptolyngbyaceae bacterium]|nr:iron uptake porin [Leptolyngbyaceae bacterium]